MKHMAALEDTGMAFQNDRAMFGSDPTAIPNGTNQYRLISDYWAVSAMPIFNLENFAWLTVLHRAYPRRTQQLGWPAVALGDATGGLRRPLI